MHYRGRVNSETQNEFLGSIGHFPETLRMMCLNIWATGSRISEVCTIAGGDYSYDGEEMRKSIAAMKDAEFREFRIGYLYGSYNSHSALPIQSILKIEETFPTIKFQITESYSPVQLIEKVKKGDFHAGYSVDTPPVKGIVIRHLFEEPHCALIREGDPLASKQAIKTDDLAAYTYYTCQVNPDDRDSVPRIEKQIAPSRKNYLSGTIISLMEHIRLTGGYTTAGAAFFKNYNLEGLKIIPITDYPKISHDLILSAQWKDYPEITRQIIETILSFTRQKGSKSC